MERELALCRTIRHIAPRYIVLKLFLFFFLLSITVRSAESKPVFSIVLYICIWKRPLLTDFVLSHYNGLKQSLAGDDILLNLFIVGSDNISTVTTANRFSASFAVHPNKPLGAKHNMGIQSLHSHFMGKYEKQNRESSVPDAVAVFGSDDIVNRAFFTSVRDLMVPKSGGRHHMVGLRDIFFYDLKNEQLVYTKGYRSFQSEVSGTLGCGRVYSWSLLEALDWEVWDSERNHGLDQSATRNVLKKVAMIEEVSVGVVGRERGIVAVDMKSDGYSSGTNIWRFQEVIEAVGRNGRFHDFEHEDGEVVLREAFGGSIIDELSVLRGKMVESETD